MAIRATSRSPRSLSAPITAREALPPTAPVMTTTSDRINWASTTSRIREMSRSAMPTRLTSAPASRPAAAIA